MNEQQVFEFLVQHIPQMKSWTQDKDDPNLIICFDDNGLAFVELVFRLTYNGAEVRPFFYDKKLC